MHSPRATVAITTALFVPLTIALLLTISARPDPAGAGANADGDKIDTSVATALAGAAGEVSVIVSLRSTGPAHAPKAPLRERMERTREAQERVLGSIAPDDFRVSHRYGAVPALAGVVNARAIDALTADPGVEAVSLDRRVRATLAEAVPLINADDVHALGISGEGVVAAVLDTGIDTDHPDLADDLLSEDCFLTVSGEEPPGPCHNGLASDSGAGAAEDDNSHGSHVSGIITSAGSVAPVGVAPDAGIRAFKVLNSEGTGTFSDILAAYDEIIATHPDIDVINMSLGDGGFYAAGECDGALPAFDAAIGMTRSLGMISFASAGNSGSKSGLGYPACISAIVSVGAVYDDDLGPRSWSSCSDASTAADQVVCFSQSNVSLDLLAPGSSIVSTVRGGGSAAFSGTSMSSPAAAGAAALLIESEPLLTPADLEARLKETGVPVTDAGNGVTTCRIDILEAVIDDGGPVCAASAPPPPANDPLAGAIEIFEPLPYANTQNTFGATIEDFEPRPCGLIGATVWYRFTLAADLTITADTIGSDFDTVLAAYNGSGPLALLDCNDDTTGLLSEIEFVTSAGTLYYIQAGGFLGGFGELTLNVSSAPPPTPTITPTPTPTKLPPPGDSDGDGCSDEQENGPDEALGGRRSHTNPWDFYDTNSDLVINIVNDLLTVGAAFGPTSDPAVDRSPRPTEAEEPDPDKRDPWDMGPPDGEVNIVTDILGVALQFGHTCE